jgi:hypothetical protein
MHGAPPSEAPCIISHPTNKQIQMVIYWTAWHGGCHAYGMLKMNNRILKEVAFQLESGNPAWGMLFANEYLSSECWLRRALRARYISRATKPALCPQLIEKLLAGARAAELCKEELREIGARSIPPRQRVIPVAPPRTVAERHISRLRVGVRC